MGWVSKSTLKSASFFISVLVVTYGRNRFRFKESYYYKSNLRSERERERERERESDTYAKTHQRQRYRLRQTDRQRDGLTVRVKRIYNQRTLSRYIRAIKRLQSSKRFFLLGVCVKFKHDVKTKPKQTFLFLISDFPLFPGARQEKIR